MTEPNILFDMWAPHVARITLNRPAQRNAQDTAFLYALNDAFNRAALDDQVRVIVLAAAGPHFSAGHDLKEGGDDFGKLVAQTAGYDTVGTWGGFAQPGAEGHFAREMEVYFGLCERWRNLPKPLIAQVHGKVIAGGLMLVWPCDIVIASEDATFHDNTLTMGVCGVEYFAHPWEMGIRKAKEYLFTADVMTAQEAWRIGMVNRIVPRDRLSEETLSLAKRIAEKSSFALKLAKEALNAAQDAQGRRGAMQLAYSYHHLLHSHWQQLGGLPSDPAFFAGSAIASRAGWQKKEGS